MWHGSKICFATEAGANQVMLEDLFGSRRRERLCAWGLCSVFDSMLGKMLPFYAIFQRLFFHVFFQQHGESPWALGQLAKDQVLHGSRGRSQHERIRSFAYDLTCSLRWIICNWPVPLSLTRILVDCQVLIILELATFRSWPTAESFRAKVENRQRASTCSSNISKNIWGRHSWWWVTWAFLSV